MLCAHAAPALRILRIPGLVQDRHQATYVLSRLDPIADAQFRKAGYVNLGFTMLGPSVLFTREPVRTLDDLKRIQLWRWDLDEISIAMLRGAGLQIVALPLEQAGAAYDDKRIDGFSALPAAALAFQWSAQARYFTELPMDYLVGCIVVSTRAFDALPLEDRQVLQTATAKMSMRAQDLEERMTEALFGTLFEKQGMHHVPPSKLLWCSSSSRRATRARGCRQLVDRELLAASRLARRLSALSAESRCDAPAARTVNSVPRRARSRRRCRRRGPDDLVDDRQPRPVPSGAPLVVNPGSKMRDSLLARRCRRRCP